MQLSPLASAWPDNWRATGRIVQSSSGQTPQTGAKIIWVEERTDIGPTAKGPREEASQRQLTYFMITELPGKNPSAV